MQLARVVTEVAPDGSADFRQESLDSPFPVGPMDFYMLWGTETDRSQLGDANPAEVLTPYWPGPGGTRFLLVRWAPRSERQDPPEDPNAFEQAVERQLPGLLSSFEPDSLGMHTSDTIDYGVCLEGELWLGLDEGREVRLTPGTCVVQRGTQHVWENRSDQPALMMFVLVGAERRG